MNTNDAAEKINKLLGSTRPVIRKPVPVEPVLDEYTIEELEAYAGSNGLTLDEATAEWLKRHASTFGYVKR